MSAPGNALGSGTLDLPPFSLDVEVLNLGAEIKAVGLELLETESREPVRGAQAAQIWSASFPALAGEEFYALDFSATSIACAIFAPPTKFLIAKPPNAAW